MKNLLSGQYVENIKMCVHGTLQGLRGLIYGQGDITPFGHFSTEVPNMGFLQGWFRYSPIFLTGLSP
jgi:hypothetical protein